MMKSNQENKMNILLEKIAKEQKYEDYILNIHEVNSGGTNISAKIYLIEIQSPGKPVLKLFAKAAALSEPMRQNMPITCPYTIEIYAYSKVLKQYQRIEDKYIPIEHRVRVPKFYGSVDEYLNETLILENLVAEGFEDFNRKKSADLEYMSAAVELMAKFHALSLAYHKEDPVEFAKDTEHITTELSQIEKAFNNLNPQALAKAYKVTEDKHKEKFKKYLLDDPDNIRQLIEVFRCRKRNVLIHGDFKPSNLMHRRRNGKLELVLMDFQLMRDGDPVLDLLYFIFTATDEEFRRQHYHARLDEYYQKLCAALRRLHLDPEQAYPEETYRTELEESKMLGIVMGVILLPMVLMDEDNDQFETEGLTDFAVDGSALYRERFNGILNNYVEWGLL